MQNVPTSPTPRHMATMGGIEFVSRHKCVMDAREPLVTQPYLTQIDPVMHNLPHC